MGDRLLGGAELRGVMNGGRLGVMNTDKLVRSTFVLDRETSDRLTYIARRFGRSRSDLVREVLAEPVAVMESLVRGVPENPTQADLRQLALRGLDAIDDIQTREIAPLRRLVSQ